MTQQRLRSLIQSYWLIFLAGYATLSASILIVLLSPAAERSGATAFLLVGYGVLFAVAVFLFDAKPIFTHLYLLVQLVILFSAIRLSPSMGLVVGVLLLPITSQAPLFLPVWQGFAWVAFFFTFTVVGTANDYSDWLTLALNAALNAGGFIGFGGFGAMLRQSERRREEGERLFSELQETYAQLQQYTQQAEQLAVSEERNRLAREMHDALGHRLTVAVVQLEGAKRLIPTDPERAAGIVDNMRTQLKEALAELRQTLGALRTEQGVHEAVSLETAVSKLTTTFQSATGLPIHLTLPPDLPDLPAEHHTALFRAAQESLTNVQRHANATQAWLTIALQNGDVVLTTRDDGQGFAGLVPDGRFGLRGLQERAEQLGGTVQLASIEPKGAELTFKLPLPEGNYG